MQVLLVIAGVLFCYMAFLFLLSLVRRDNGTADIGYGIGFIVVALSTLFLSATRGITLLLAVLVIVWGTRLATRIYFKNKGKPEDFRYRTWRESWGSVFVVRSFLQIYLLQGVVIFLVSLPILVAFILPRAPYFPLVFIGVAMWLVGFFFEAVGDYQLDTFLRLKTGGIMQSGLWRYTRHPNYFGESLMWWGMAVASAGFSAYPWIGFVSPILITYLLLKVSGVPLLEKRWEGNPEWEAYKARTSVFIPLPPSS